MAKINGKMPYSPFIGIAIKIFWHLIASHTQSAIFKPWNNEGDIYQ